MSIPGLITVTAFALYCMGVLALVFIRNRRLHQSKRNITNEKIPFVSILKPIKGIDDGLEENLESFFQLNYPEYEIIFGSAEENDPGLEIVMSLMRKYTKIPARIVTGSSGKGANPKVSTLLKMFDYAKGDIVVISDSNTRVEPGYLKESIPYFDDPKVALLSHFLTGKGEKSIGAIFEHMHICGFIPVAQAFASVYARITPVIGKSMIIRKKHLEEVGGLESLSDYLAEDYLLGRKLSSHKKKVLISPHTVTNFNSQTTVSNFFRRHHRWLAMRWRINPASCILEFFSIPTVGLILWLTGGASSIFYPILLYIAYILLEQGVIAMVRDGKPLPLISFLLFPIKDLLHIAILISSVTKSSVEWRGNYFKLGWKTKLTPVKAELKGPSDVPARIEVVQVGVGEKVI